MDVKPLLRVDLVRTEFFTNLIIKYFGGGTRQRLQPGVLQSSEIAHEVHLGTSGALKDFKGAERVDVDLRRASSHGGDDVDV